MSDCCEEGGGNCNPAKALNLAPSDEMMIWMDGEDVLTVRLAGNIFGTWACEDGSLKVAYIADGDRPPEPVSDDMLTHLADIYTFTNYLYGRQGVPASGE